MSHESQNIPVRFDEETIERLDQAAKRTGLTRTTLIRVCTTSFVNQFERDGLAALPVDWEEIANSVDGRRSESRPLSKTVPFEVDGNLLDQIDRRAAELGVNRSQYIRAAVSYDLLSARA